MTDEPVEVVVDRGAQEWARINATYERGEIDGVGWFEAVSAVLVPKYLDGDNPRGTGTTGVGGARPGARLRIAGRDEIPHPDPRVVRRVLWVDRDE